MRLEGILPYDEGYDAANEAIANNEVLLHGEEIVEWAAQYARELRAADAPMAIEEIAAYLVLGYVDGAGSIRCRCK